MAQQLINNGTIAGDGTGEVLFSAFTKTNDNFTELYSRIKEVKVTVTASQLKDLIANPKSIIPAAGANKVIKIITITGFLDFGTAIFDFVSNLKFQYETSGIVINEGTYADWNAHADLFFDIDKTASSGGELSANEGVVLTVATDATVGDSTVTIVALYSEQDFS
jgi:hypothetical protein